MHCRKMAQTTQLLLMHHIGGPMLHLAACIIANKAKNGRKNVVFKAAPNPTPTHKHTRELSERMR